MAVALFLSYGGAHQFGTLADAVTSIGIIAGLIGTDFVLVMVVLAARIPIIDRSIGHDRAIALHRALGKPALYLLIAHGVVLLIGYGMSSGIDPISEIGPMLALPDMPLAFVALGLLILVVITSLVALRRRYSHELWHSVHLLSYLAVAFALPHQLSVGGILAAGSFQRGFWIAFYLIAFGSLAIFRLIKPILGSARHRITVAEVVSIAPGVTSIYLRGRNLRALGSLGGQFFIWRFWSAKTWWHPHPMSLSAMPTDSLARITVRDLGRGSASLTEIPAGTPVSIEGPYGLFSDIARTSPRLAVIAAGVGVTAVRALLEDSDFAPGEATILLRANNMRETFLWEEIQDIATAKGAALYTMIGRRSSTGPGWMTEEDARRGVTLESVFPHLADSDLYICGPAAWLDLVEADARDAGMRAHQIHSERFDW